MIRVGMMNCVIETYWKSWSKTWALGPAAQGLPPAGGPPQIK